MAKVRFELITRTVPAHAVDRRVRDNIEQAVLPLAVTHVRRRNQIVQNWSNQPIFDFRLESSPNQLTLFIFIVNQDQPVGERWTIQKLWAAIDRFGTPPHVIVATRAKFLHFIGS